MLIYKLKLPCGNSGFIGPRDEQAEKKVTIFVEAVGCAHQNDLGLMLHHGSKEEYVWHLDNPLGQFLLICSITESRDKYGNLTRKRQWPGVRTPKGWRSGKTLRLTEGWRLRALKQASEKRTWLKLLSTTLELQQPWLWFISLTLLFSISFKTISKNSFKIQMKKWIQVAQRGCGRVCWCVT